MDSILKQESFAWLEYPTGLGVLSVCNASRCALTLSSRSPVRPVFSYAFSRDEMDRPWLGTPVDELNRMPQCAPPLSHLKPTPCHTVTVRVSSPFVCGCCLSHCCFLSVRNAKLLNYYSTASTHKQVTHMCRLSNPC